MLPSFEAETPMPKVLWDLPADQEMEECRHLRHERLPKCVVFFVSARRHRQISFPGFEQNHFIAERIIIRIAKRWQNHQMLRFLVDADTHSPKRSKRQRLPVFAVTRLHFINRELFYVRTESFTRTNVS